MTTCYTKGFEVSKTGFHRF